VGQTPSEPQALAAESTGALAVHATETKLLRVFKQADADSNGLLEGRELDPILRTLQGALGLAPENLEELWRNISMLDYPKAKQIGALLYLLKHADKDGDGLLDTQELKFHGLRWAEKVAGVRVDPARWQQLFDEADADSDGKLRVTELRYLLSVVWEVVLPPELTRLFRHMDADRNGVLEGFELRALAVELRSRFLLSRRAFLGVAGPENRWELLDWPAFQRLFNQMRHRSPLSRLPRPVATLFAALTGTGAAPWRTRSRTLQRALCSEVTPRDSAAMALAAGNSRMPSTCMDSLSLGSS